MKVGTVLQLDAKEDGSKEIKAVVISKKTETIEQTNIAIMQNIFTKEIFIYNPDQPWKFVGEWDYFQKEIMYP